MSQFMEIKFLSFENVSDGTKVGALVAAENCTTSNKVSLAFAGGSASG